MSERYLPRLLTSYAFDPSLIANQMVFLAGPRQVGKTLLAQKFLEERGSPELYFNWDDPSVRQAYRKDPRFFESSSRHSRRSPPWIVFDEIHKRSGWRNILKGAYDPFKNDFRFLITGSARLDFFRKGGDSLVGRYSLFHLLPLNLYEIFSSESSLPPPWLTTDQDRADPPATFETRLEEMPVPSPSSYETLYRFGPFPQPLLQASLPFSRKWHDDYLSLVLRDDLRDLTQVREIDQIEKLLSLLPSRLQSPLSLAALGRDLEAAHTTVKSWMEQLRRLFLVFPVPPWSRKIHRSLRKEQKWYFFDWWYAANEPARLENMVAAHLERTRAVLTDRGLGRFELWYVRTLDKKEIDFLLTRDRRPILAVEVKTDDENPSRPLLERDRWFQTETVGVQVVHKDGILKKYPGRTWVMSASRFLSLLP